MSTRPQTLKSLEMLFKSRWNVPEAAENCGLTNKEMKIVFNEYCKLHPVSCESERRLD